MKKHDLLVVANEANGKLVEITMSHTHLGSAIKVAPKILDFITALDGDYIRTSNGSMIALHSISTLRIIPNE